MVRPAWRPAPALARCERVAPLTFAAHGSLHALMMGVRSRFAPRENAAAFPLRLPLPAWRWPADSVAARDLQRLAMFGLVGGPLIFASAIAVLFGAYEQDGAHFLFSIPEIVFEFSITIYTIVKGFRPSPILDDTRYAGAGAVSGSAPAPA